MSEVKWERHYYPGGSLLSKTPFIKGRAQGLEKGYYSDGELMWESPYVNNQRHGVVKWYNKDGTPRRAEVWIRGAEREGLLGDEYRLERLILLGGECE